MERFEGRPFAIVGVNTDKEREETETLIQAGTVTWRSFWDGPAGVRGPISTTWNVKEWPSMYLIDHDGIIRYRWVVNTPPDNAVLDAAIVELIEKAETEGR